MMPPSTSLEGAKRMISQNAAFAVEPQVTLSGDIDTASGPELSRLEKRLAEPDAIVIDVSKVDYVDTTFIRFLVNLKHHTNKVDKSSIKIVGVSPRLRRIFEVTGLMRQFDIECA
jgi:anti-sigma B factor antagonist